MDFGGFNWGLIKFVGPIVLIAVLAWAMLRNRAQRGRRAETEAATRQVYRQEDRAGAARRTKCPDTLDWAARIGRRGGWQWKILPGY